MMNTEHLFFKLKLRKYLLRVRDNSVTRGVLLNAYRAVPIEVIDAVIDECVNEGTVTAATGNKNCVVYTWHEEAVSRG
jgi:hypothetical protein